MTGTPSRTARVFATRRNLKETAGKLLARGTRIAYEASIGGSKDSKPDVIRIESTYMRRVCGRKVTRLTLRDLRRCQVASDSARSRDVVSEVSRGHSCAALCEGPNLLTCVMQKIRCPTADADRRLRCWSND